MPNPSAEAFEDGIDLQIGLLEAFVPKLSDEWQGYPFPSLRTAGDQEMRTFRTIVLENPYLRVTLLPGMGGRIISLFDKRTDKEILRRHPMIEPQPGGLRGAFVREGVQICLQDHERLNAMGNVSTQIDREGDEDAEAAVWIAETYTGCGLSLHVRMSLPPDRAEVRFEARVLNRRLEGEVYNGGLKMYLGEGSFEGNAFYSRERDAGLAFSVTGPPFDGVGLQDGVVQFLRFPMERELAARQVDSWSVTLTPISGLGGLMHSSHEAAVSLESGVLRIQSVSQRLSHKLFLLTDDGKTLEAPVDLYPENILEIPLDGLNPSALVLKDPGKNEVMRYEPGNSIGELPSDIAQPARTEAPISLASDDKTLLEATFDLGTRHLAHTLLGMRAMSQKQYEAASACFEQAMMYNAEDPLLWWAKGVALRLANMDNEAELLNAHYLAPLEPALRAESFLSQPVSLDADPSPLLAPLEENAEEFIEVACLLVECGLFDQASRWIDEALRHRDLPMLRYLMAYCLVAATRLDAEASEQIRLAAKSPIAPPFPFRDVERQALRKLLEVFPGDEKLRILGALADKPITQS